MVIDRLIGILPTVGMVGCYQKRSTKLQFCDCGEKHLEVVYEDDGSPCLVQTMAVNAQALDMDFGEYIAVMMTPDEVSYPGHEWLDTDDGQPSVILMVHATDLETGARVIGALDVLSGIGIIMPIPISRS